MSGRRGRGSGWLESLIFFRERKKGENEEADSRARALEKRRGRKGLGGGRGRERGSEVKKDRGRKKKRSSDSGMLLICSPSNLFSGEDVGSERRRGRFLFRACHECKLFCH